MENSLITLVIRFRWFLLVMTLLMSVGSAYGLKFFKFDSSPKAFVDDDNAGYNQLLDIEDEFGRTNTAVILIAPAPGVSLDKRNNFMFERKQLDVLVEFTDKAWMLPNVLRVDSLINHQHTWGEDDSLFVESLLEEPELLSDEDIDKAASVLTKEPVLLDRLLSADGNYTGMVVKFNLDRDDQTSANISGAAIYELFDELENKYPDIRIYASGTLLNNYITMKLATTDTSKVVGIMYLVMFVLLAVLLRSILAMLIIVFVTIISLLAGVGLACWGGSVFTSLTISSISIIITVTIAHCVHIFIGFFQKYRHGQEKMDALSSTLSINLQPVFLTSFTTVIGFLSMNISDMPPMRDLGNISACGVIVAFFCSYTILPALIALLPLNRKLSNKDKTDARKEGFAQIMDKTADIVVRNHKLLLAICVVVSALSVYLAFQNVINDRMAEAIDKPHPVREGIEMVDKHMGGLYNIQFQFAAEQGQTISSPEYLKALDAFAEYMRQQPEVTNVFTFSDVIKRLNRNLHDDNPDFYQIPESSELASQYLLLYEMSLPAGMDLSNQLSSDKTSSRVVVTFKSLDTYGVTDLRKRITDWQSENMPEYMRYNGTSYTIIWNDLTIDALGGSIKGALIALCLISLVLAVVFRSISLGIISFIPNLLPAAYGFAFWKLYSGELNLGVMMVLTITIGIVVDDTVHFMSKYQRAFKESGGDAAEAVRSAFANVGPALFLTTLVLMTGFGIMVNSQFVANSTQGLMICAVLLSALTLDFFMLPPMLMLLKGKKGK